MNETHVEFMRLGFAFSVAFALLSIPFAILTALLAYLVVGSSYAAPRLCSLESQRGALDLFGKKASR